MKNRRQLKPLLLILSLSFIITLFGPAFSSHADAAAFDLAGFLGLNSTAKTAALTGIVSSSSYTSPDSHALEITWQEIAEAKGYELLLSHNGTSTTYDSSSPNITIKELIGGAVYSYQIRYYKTADDGTKLYSDYSIVFTAITQVPKVTGLKVNSYGATSTTASLSLAWEAQGEASYQIYYKKASDADFIHVADSAAASFNLENLEPLQNYIVKVRAFQQDSFGDFSDELQVTTCPVQVSGLQISSTTTSQIDLIWNAVDSAPFYYIYRSVNDSEYSLYTTTSTPSLSDTNLTPGTVYFYKIYAWSEAAGLAGPFSEILRAVTNPPAVTNLAITGYTSKTISLSWDSQVNSTGYLIYRMDPNAEYVLVGSTLENVYTDTTVASGKTYRYKVRAYADTEAHIGDFSNIVKMSTLPAQPAVKPKAGYGKLRLSWGAVTGSAGYYVYQQGDDGTFTLINTLEGKSSTAIVYDNLEIGTPYYYKIYSYRSALGQTFVSEEPEIVTVIPIATKKTTTAAFLFKTAKKLKKSAAWKTAAATKAVKYTKSYVIPGLSSTNVAGFASTNMCPQAMCFAGKYMLITAYDRDGEENSVIYVLNKSSKKLKTVIVLENKTHAGGMCFDGTDVWVTYGSKLCSIPYTTINKSANSNDAFTEVKFTATCKLESKASFATYYNDLIWVGSYNASGNGELYSYRIKSSGSGKISMVSVNSMSIPSAVQGIAFTSKGQLLFSRAYSYIHQLDIYKPKKSGSNGSMKLGTRIKSVSMPFLSQGIDINGNYLYVNFESAVSPQSIDHMDRVLGFQLKKILKVKKA